VRLRTEYKKLSRICVVTSKARAYYALVSRLRRAEIPFSSLVPGSKSEECDLVLTTREEAPPFGGRAVALEDLDENPGVFKGQLMSRLGDDVVLVGIDPGKRTGLAVFYGRTRLAFNTFDSVGGLCSRMGTFAAGLPGARFVVRIGNGNRGMAAKLVEALARAVPAATIEVVDESGTSARTARLKGVQGDQGAAARIAFRRGEVVVSSGIPRTRG
jgi:hypothetical protein